MRLHRRPPECGNALASPALLQTTFDQVADAVFFVKDAAGRYQIVTPQQLLARTRLDEAARRLRTTTEDIATIAHACGDSHHGAFTRKFRSTLGLSPSAYRAAIGMRIGSSRRRIRS